MAESTNRPDHDDVMAWMDGLRSKAPAVAEFSEIGQSVQGRPMSCIVLTDPAAPAAKKQHVFIVAGQHGTEESGRAMAMALVDFLLSGEAEAADILRKQVIAVVPCANPDGAATNQSRNAEGVDIAHTYAHDAPAASPEGRALEQFAAEFVPDVVVDIHGRGGGGMKELAWLNPAWGFSSDRYFLTAMSMAMAQAGEEAGFPQCELAPARPLKFAEGHTVMLGERLAGQFKTLALGLETIEYYYRQEDWRATGLVRLRRLLRFGCEDAFGLGEPGYPNVLVSGNRIYGLKAHGATAAARRESRVELTAFLRRNWALVDRGPDGRDGCAKVKVFSETVEGPNPQRFSILLRIKSPCEIKTVTWDGQALQPDAGGHGYRTWSDHCSVFVQADIQAPFGGPERFLVVEYDCPYFQAS